MKMHKRLILLAMGIVLAVCTAVQAGAQEDTPAPSNRFSLFTNTPPPTSEPVPQYDGDGSKGYSVFLKDGADLLTPEEEESLIEAMRPLTEYGNVLFWTTNEKVEDPLLALQQYVDRTISPSLSVPSVSFSINMGNRMMNLLTRGASLQQAVDSSEANAITDRNSHLASKKEYAECAKAVFGDVLNAMNGIYAFSAMRTVCAVLLAMGIALLVVFIAIQKRSLQEGAEETTTIMNRKNKITSFSVEKRKISSTRRVKPVYLPSTSSRTSCSSCSSCSSGSSCSSCSSGSSCSSCGSGGGSSF